jgi:superfamily II DNA or RNA helicase
MGAFDSLYDNLDPNEQKRGFEFEHVCKWFLENDPTYVSRLKTVWLWKQWKQRWSEAEAGIDLVAEDLDGKLWAIQAKAYGENRPIPKRELDKFLSVSNRKEFSFRLLITTTSEGLHHIAAETVAAQEKPVLIVGRSDLRDSPVDWPESLSGLRPAPPRESARPRPHQGEAILDVIGGFATHDRGQLIMACGTGKTLTSWFINEKLGAQRTLVLVPSLSLLKQTMREWERASGGRTRFASMPVCSDSSVSSTEDDSLAYTAELGVPAKTDPAEIARFLRGRGPRVVFSTYHSSPQIAKAYELGRVPAFDIVFADEAHRVAGLMHSDFATVLHASRIKAHKRLFMTATPRVYSSSTKKVAKDENFEQASMDDHEKFGPVFHKLGFGEAIERKLLTGYRVAIIGVTDTMFHDWTQRGTFVTFDGETPITADRAAAQIGLAKAMKEFDLRRTISFHSRVSRAAKFAATMKPVIAWMPQDERPTGELWTGYASGEMDAGKRARLIQHLADLEDADRGLLTNARCLAEGVDVPTLDGVAFIDPRRSEVDIVQAVGRAIRKSEAKKLGTIVIPVFVRDTGDPETALDDSSFKPVWDVLRALRSHDDELGRQLDILRREMGSEGRAPELPPNIYTDIPKSIGAAFARAFRIRLVEQTTVKWEFWYGLMEMYVAQHHTALMPTNFIVDGHRLGQWTQIQRMAFSEGKIEQERREKLESLPGWTWRVLDFKWEEGFEHAAQYVAEFGDAVIPGDYQSPDGYRLGQWIGVQRSAHAVEKLSPERQNRLESLSGWVWDALGSQWEYGFRHAEEYLSETGHARIPGDYRSPNGFRLGQWAGVQRLNNSKGKLSPDRKARLDGLPGWVWDRYSTQWERGYEHASAYGREVGNTVVPALYKSPDGFPLGHWVRVQARTYHAGNLSPERRERLEALPGWVWRQRESKWDKCFRLFRAFVEDRGSTAVPRDHHEEGVGLLAWVKNQRRAFATGTIKPDRAAKLESLPGWSWNTHDDAWEEGLSHMEEYAKTSGNCLVAALYVSPDGFGLGRWVNAQRVAHTKGKLRTDRRERLQAIPGWIWDAIDARWEEGRLHTAEYAGIKGHVKVDRRYRTPDGFRLANWITVQRTNYTRRTLSAERIRRLEAIPGWEWNPHEDAWREGVAHLSQYLGEFGHTCVPQDYVSSDGFRLGGWVVNQRGNRRDGSLREGRQEQLESFPGWVWDTREARWADAYGHAEEYVAQHGDASIPREYRSADGFKLGHWVKRQRDYFASGGLSEERIGLLEALPGWVWRV